MKPSSHFRFISLALISLLLLPDVMPLSHRCQQWCKEEKRDSGVSSSSSHTIYCQRFSHQRSGCGARCSQYCDSSDCNYDGNVNCPSDDESRSSSSSNMDPTWMWVSIVVAVLVLIAICAGVGACVYCCVKGSRRQPAMVGAGGGMPMAPGVYGQPQPQMSQVQQRPVVMGPQQPVAAGGTPQAQPPPPSNNPFLRPQQQAPATPQPPAKA